MSKPEQRRYIDWRAPELARSGQYRDWREIETQLRMEGVSEAKVTLSNPERRRWLDGLCSKANLKRHY